MSLKDFIYISHVGDDFIKDKELLISKLIIQHKWSDKFYKARQSSALTPAPTTYPLFEPVFEKTYAEYKRIYQDNTEIDDKLTKSQSYYLTQNKDCNAYNWHHHIPRLYYTTNFYDENFKFLVSAVYYLRLPEGSGGIKFKDDFEEIELMPSEGDLFFFPNNMLHTPSLNTCTDYRISFNINLIPKNYRGDF